MLNLEICSLFVLTRDGRHRREPTPDQSRTSWRRSLWRCHALSHPQATTELLPAARCAEATSQAGMAWRVPFSAEKLRHADHPMMVDDQGRILLSINRISKFGIACSRIGLDAGQMIRDLHPRHSSLPTCVKAKQELREIGSYLLRFVERRGVSSRALWLRAAFSVVGRLCFRNRSANASSASF